MAIVVSIFLVLLWRMMAFQANLLQAKGIQVLPPVNFTLTVSALAEVLLQWKPNPDQEKNYTVEYNVEIMTPEWEPYETKKTCSTRTAVLHNGFSARIRTLLLYNNSQIESNWVTAKLQAPPGAVETSVTNLSCVIYTAIDNTASLHCTWLAGKEAPEDTKYFLFYRYNSYTEECQEYSKDKWERNIGCRFSNTYIKTSETDEVIVIHINGSSKYTAIKSFEQLFNPQAIEKVNPPRNVTVFLKQNNLLIIWEMPASSFPEDCFEYELNIYNWKMDYRQILETMLNSFSLSIDDTCRYSIQIRANRQSWCSEGIWSDWTEPLHIGKNQPRTPVDSKAYTVLVALLVFICSVALLTAIICRKCHLWSRLFPPIPTPHNSLKNLFLNKSYQRTHNFTSETETEIGSCCEDLGSYVEDLSSDVLEDSCNMNY
ncbi:interleukin-5 receptor subunit alpha [Gopherus flavomarginatus]|uniref:interleukin-5 receptor subunit alpha n=1 Tax=Gopherus flavomarginatus TaxID=286002 RepID=UPI0021CC2515|nr:interleukin-5 receptor subunit alpha [Gopherus flavomarginatus]XP_050813450.1 interleukin-5 receptor subunit alpha [Gopherus flavomarginatus]XP_050813451.1 interleukin-5 receptor subunit alpha [Gopherus flavomarginatus]